MITASTRIALVPPKGPDVPVRTTLTYSTAAPYTVNVAFRISRRRDDDIVWELSRELLATGMLGDAGLGDIQLRPYPARPRYLQLTLRAPDGAARFAVRAATIGAFLARTYSVVPLGAELGYLDLDAALAALLAEQAGA